MAVKERLGLVVSDKMNKTVVVAVESRVPHPKYKKIMARTKRYKVHDEENQCQVGDQVRIRETRPLRKTKRWVAADILNRDAANPPTGDPAPAADTVAAAPETPAAEAADTTAPSSDIETEPGEA